MKIALCFHGNYGNRDDSLAGDRGYLYLKDIIFDKYSSDVFIHSWQLDKKDDILKKYSPKNFVFEKQINFLPFFERVGITDRYFNRGFDRKNTIFKNCTIHNTASFLYSRKKSIELSLAKGNYDVIITCRFDIGQRGGKLVRYLRFDTNDDMDYVYSAMWNQLNAGYADMWFYSNSKNMAILAQAYDKMYKHFLPNSEYERALTTGWYDSDSEQFTNERFK